MGVDAKALDLAPRLRVIALHTSGSDNVDLPEATRRGVLVTNVKGVNAEQCAEFAMGLLLTVVRQIRTGDVALRQGRWSERTQTSMDVVGSTVGTYNELVELMHLTRRGAVRPAWTTFPLEGVNDAMAALEAGQITGRGVLVPADGP